MMARYRVTHNGYGMEWFDSADEMENWIASQIEEHKNLDPKEIYRGYAGDNQATDLLETIKSVIIWQYKTMYTEVFMIEELQ